MSAGTAPIAHPHPGGAPDRPELPEGAPDDAGAGAWPPWTAPVALIASFTVALFASIVIGLVAAVFGASFTHPPASVEIVGTVAQDGALVACAVLLARAGGLRPGPRRFGLRATPVLRGVGWAALTLVGALAFTAVWSAVLAAHQREHLLHDLGADRGTVSMLAVAALVCVIAPMAEELFFRGFFFEALRPWRGTLVAALLTGLTFGAVHAAGTPLIYLAPLAFLGFALCLLYRRTGSLYPGIGVHVTNNALAFGVAESWGWQIPVLLVASLAAVAVVLGAVARAQPSATGVTAPVGLGG